jgi:predicted transcriptional regulator
MNTSLGLYGIARAMVFASWICHETAEVSMKVCDVMTREVEAIRMNASLVNAAKVMERENIGFLPVLDENETVVGVVTDRDLVVRGISQGRNVYMTQVSEVMTLAAMWCYADDVLTEAAEMMEANHIRRLLVLDGRKRLVGLLSLDDLAAKMSSDRLLGTVVRNLNAANG